MASASSPVAYDRSGSLARSAQSKNLATFCDESCRTDGCSPGRMPSASLPAATFTSKASRSGAYLLNLNLPFVQ